MTKGAWMKNFLVVLCALFGLALVSVDADAARRMGGGSSIGKQRQITPQQPTQPPASSAAPANRAQQQQPSGMSRWLGPLAGLAAGFGLASLFAHGGFGAVLGGLLMVALVVFVVMMALRMLRPKTGQEPLRYAGANPPARENDFSTAFGSGRPARIEPSRYPPGFDAEQFARHAKLNFTQLQEAHDRGDLSTMRDYMTAELYAEISRQVEARGGVAQKTDVVTLDAQVLEVVTENGLYVASVQFSGMMREASDAEAEPFKEVWHLEKPVDGSSGWLIAGIQQV
jgi:predicted lipid-binding transport protein (Tim44 family)